MMALKQGQEFDPLEIPITASAIVAGAMATNDYEPVHHDKAAAQTTGVPDIFMNILTTNGLVQRYVGERLDHEMRIEGIKLRLGAPNFVGDTMVLTGRVAEVTDAGATIEVTGRNAIGDHVTASVRVAPLGGKP